MRWRKGLNRFYLFNSLYFFRRVFKKSISFHKIVNDAGVESIIDHLVMIEMPSNRSYPVHSWFSSSFVADEVMWREQ